jgi:hypothetical protein
LGEGKIFASLTSPSVDLLSSPEIAVVGDSFGARIHGYF